MLKILSYAQKTIFLHINEETLASSHLSNHTKYKFDQTDREVFKSTLQAALGSKHFSGLTSTTDLDKYADFYRICN